MVRDKRERVEGPQGVCRELASLQVSDWFYSYVHKITLEKEWNICKNRVRLEAGRDKVMRLSKVGQGR